MAINNKLLMDLAKELGIENTMAAESKAAQYRDKSDAELLREIAGMKEKMRGNPELFEKQLKAVYALRPMMTNEQKARLDQIIRLLES